MAALGPQAVPKLITALNFKQVRHSKPLLARLVYVLGQIGPPAAPATAELAKLIADPSPHVSSEAVLALAKIGPAAKAAVPALIQAFQKDDSDDHAIAYALGRIGPEATAATPALTGGLRGSDQSLAIVSAWALGQIHPASAETAAATLPVLTAGLAAPLAESRQAAAHALADLGPLASRPQAALQKAASDKDENVRQAAAEALKAIGRK